MTVELTRNGPCAVVTLNRPDAMNALSFEIIREIGSAIDEVDASNARALLITGAGDKAFCAGADIKELRNRDVVSQKDGAELGQSVFAKLDGCRLPSIALINGYAFGGGLELALACTFRIATPSASMGLPEIKLGLIPGYGGTQRLPRLIGEARAYDMILTGRTVGAEEALAMGLVHSIANNDLIEAGLSLAGRVTRFSLPALKFARDAIHRGMQTSLTDGLAIEADLSTLAYRMADAEEGMAAFEEKRKPEFKDV